MGIIEQTLITIIISLDSFFVMAYVTLSNKNLKIEKSLLIFSVLSLTVIQTLLAYLGLTIGQSVIVWIQDWDHWVVFIFFSYLAWKQWGLDPKLNSHGKKLTYISIILLALACSVDAFVVSLPMAGFFYGLYSYLLAVFLFTVLLSILGIIVFRKANKVDWKISSKISSVLIFLLGLKILLEHLA